MIFCGFLRKSTFCLIYGFHKRAGRFLNCFGTFTSKGVAYKKLHGCCFPLFRQRSLKSFGFTLQNLVSHPHPDKYRQALRIPQADFRRTEETFSVSPYMLIKDSTTELFLSHLHRTLSCFFSSYSYSACCSLLSMHSCVQKIKWPGYYEGTEWRNTGFWR